MRRATRRVSTVVLPVPAPATTSIGPWTCSMASRCLGSSSNGARGARRLLMDIRAWKSAVQHYSPPGAFQQLSFCLRAIEWRIRLQRLQPVSKEAWRVWQLLPFRCDNGYGGDRGGFDAENGAAERRGDPSRVCERLMLALSPSA